MPSACKQYPSHRVDPGMRQEMGRTARTESAEQAYHDRRREKQIYPLGWLHCVTRASKTQSEANQRARKREC